jgi:hypothetical protein
MIKISRANEIHNNARAHGTRNIASLRATYAVCTSLAGKAASFSLAERSAIPRADSIPVLPPHPPLSHPDTAQKFSFFIELEHRPRDGEGREKGKKKIT